MKVSVCVITYNQAAFIEQTVESVLMQETNFPFELVVGDDCSQDGAQEILASYAKRYPQKVRVLIAEKNLGPNKNLIRTYQACQGEYVAALDGDDYWTSPYKLQEQADFLDAHPECSACFHAFKVVGGAGPGERIVRPKGRRTFYTAMDYAKGLVFNPCVLMFRNRLFEFPEWYPQALVGDWPLQALLAERGPVGYIDEVMAAYRIQNAGVCASQGYRGNYEKMMMACIQTHQLLLSHSKPPFEQLYRRHLYDRYYSLAHHLCNVGEQEKAKFYARKCLQEWGYDMRVSALEPFKLYAHIYAGRPYTWLRGLKERLLGNKDEFEASVKAGTDVR